MSSTTEKPRKRRRAPRMPVWQIGLWAIAGVLLLLVEVVLWSWSRALWVEDQTPQQAAPRQGRWVQAHDVQLYVQEFGDPLAPTLLLTHGTGAWSGTWDLNIAALVATGYRVVAVDLPPFGFSTRPASRDYSRSAQAQRLLGLVDNLQRGPVTLLGHSYGGGPAAEAAMLGPDRVSHLILVDAAIGLQPQPVPSAEPGLAAWLLGQRPLRTALIATVGTQPMFSEFWLRQFVSRKEVVTPERTAIYREPFVLKGFGASLGDWAEQFAGEHGAFVSETPTGFRNLVPPLTLVWGEQDTITPLAQANALTALVPHARLVVLTGVGHIPQIEDPAQFNARMGAVLSR